MIYLLTVVLDTGSKILFRILNYSFTKRSMIANYLLQVMICTVIFKEIAEVFFERIDISFLGLVVLFLIIYAVYYVMLDDEETID
nr:hypothetical protein [Jeotgalibacillus malaysiensis]